MSPWQILFKVELPLAMPTIFAGIRMSTVYTVSWAVLTAMIGLGGLGEFVYRGVSTNNSTLTITGAIPGGDHGDRAGRAGRLDPEEGHPRAGCRR